MKLWSRRLLYFLAIALWLLLLCAPILAFVLAARGRLQFGSDPQSHLRLFLVQEEDTAGVGIEWTRPLGAAQPHCANTTLTYFLWEGEGEDSRFCRCFDSDEADSLSSEVCRDP